MIPPVPVTASTKVIFNMDLMSYISKFIPRPDRLYSSPTNVIIMNAIFNDTLHLSQRENAVYFLAGPSSCIRDRQHSIFYHCLRTSPYRNILDYNIVHA